MRNGKAKKPRSTTGTINPATLRKLKIISAHRGIQKWEALDKYGGPGIDREYRRVLEESHREFGEAGA